MKKIVCSLLVLVLALGMFAGCGAKTNLEGTPIEILEQFNANATTEVGGVITPVEINGVVTEEIPADNVEYFTGLTEEDYEKYIESGARSDAMITVNPHSMVILKVKDGVDAVEVAKKVFDGINPRRWICVQPAGVYVNTSEDYIFMIMSNDEWMPSLINAFETLSGDIGEALEKDGEGK